MILSVSSSHKTFNCKKVMEKLLECGIEVNIIENYTIVRKNNKSYSEIGCKIEFIDNPDIQYLKKKYGGLLKKNSALIALIYMWKINSAVVFIMYKYHYNYLYINYNEWICSKKSK